MAPWPASEGSIWIQQSKHQPPPRHSKTFTWENACGAQSQNCLARLDSWIQTHIQFPVHITKTCLMPEFFKAGGAVGPYSPLGRPDREGPCTKEGQISRASRGLWSEWLQGLLWADSGSLLGVSRETSTQSSMALLAWVRNHWEHQYSKKKQNLMVVDQGPCLA